MGPFLLSLSGLPFIAACPLYGVVATADDPKWWGVLAVSSFVMGISLFRAGVEWSGDRAAERIGARTVRVNSRQTWYS